MGRSKEAMHPSMQDIIPPTTKLGRHYMREGYRWWQKRRGVPNTEEEIAEYLGGFPDER